MLASQVCYDKSAVGSGPVFSAFLKHLNTRNLALVLFIAMALLTPTRAEEPELTSPAPKKTAKSDVTMHDSGFLPETLMLPAAQDITCVRQGLKFRQSPQNSRKLFFVNSRSDDRKSHR
ncbi:MAG TPA: hypothetical protein VFA61_08325 [Candidatus Udaeobacter sp.]|nr:hypothetical protein [Candidatus Udaeobacter sp.]